MYGVSAKERLAQLQQKGAKPPEPGKTFGGLKPVNGKQTAVPGPLKKPEPPKAPVDPKKPVVPQPAKPLEAAKPKEEPKPAAPAVPEPAKPKDEPKPAVAPEPAKPKEEPKPAVAPQPAIPKEEPKPAVAPQPAIPKEEPKPAAAPELAKPKEEPKPATAPEPAKPKEESKPAAAPEPAKPKEEPKPTITPQAVKPKEEPKPAPAPEPAKPKEEPKPAAAPQPAKPKEEPKPVAAPQPAKPKEEPKPAAAPQPVKPKEEPKPAAAPQPVKPKEAPKAPVVEPAKSVEPAKEPEKPVTKPAAAPPSGELKKPSEDFFRGIFYFSGMGALVGSALAEGVYVPEKAQRSALDADEIESALERQRLRRGEEIIATARNQAQGLSTEFRHLQALLESLPTFTEVLEPQPLDRRAVDQVIHGHVYFQQEQHPAPFQTRATHTAAPLPPPHVAAEAPSHQAPLAKHPVGGVADEVPSHHPPVAKHPVGGVAVLPAAFDPKQATREAPVAGSFAAAMEEFDRVSATAQQPVFAAPPEARESPRLPRRERPTGDAAAAAASAAAKVPLAPGGTRPYGEHTGQADVPASAWQDRYGQVEVAKFQAPRPFSATGGEIDSRGVKPWQLSHLRTLEAKGYQIVSDSEKDAVKSYAPYLVSDRSQRADRQVAFHPHDESSHPRQPSFKAPATPFAVDSSALPYSDL